MLRRYARVIDNVDPDQTGMIQIRPIPEGKDWEDENLPWARPIEVGVPEVSEGVGKHSVPAIGSVITVYISDDWQDYDYSNEAPTVTDWYPYTSATEAIDTTYLEAFEYPDPHFTKTPDGTIIFHNRSNGELGIQHPTGLFVVIDKEGNLYVKFIKQIILHNEDESIKLHLDGENNEIDIIAGTTKITSETEVVVETPSVHFDTQEFKIGDGSDNVALFTPLEKVLNELIKAQVIAPTGPSSPLVDSALTPLVAKLIADIPKIKSTVSTSD